MAGGGVPFRCSDGGLRVLCYALTGWWSTLETGKRRLISATLAGQPLDLRHGGVTVAMLAWCRRYRLPRD